MWNQRSLHCIRQFLSPIHLFQPEVDNIVFKTVSHGTILRNHCEVQQRLKMIYSFISKKGHISRSFKSISQIAAKLSPVLTDAQKRLLFRLCLAAALLSRLAARSMDLIQPRYVKPIKELRRLACSTFKEVWLALLKLMTPSVFL